MNKELLDTIELFDYPRIDWMNYKITKNNPLTYHHIIKKCDGGLKTIENCGLLTMIGHRYIHIIESRDIEVYIFLNKMFYLFHKQGCNPTLDQRIMIQYVLEDFERRFKEDTNCKGRRLIKDEYKRRII